MAGRTGVRIATVALGAFVVAGCGASGSSSSSDRAGPALGKPGRPLVQETGGPQGTGGEVDAAERPVSTFAMDVDTASYGYARRTIRDGRRPDPSTVRPEEFVNAFRQDYRDPAGNGFSVQADGARFPASHRGSTGADRIMRIGLQTRREDAAARPDAALTFVVDVSGSMGEPGKLDLVKDALRTLVGQLRPTDSVALVAYDDTARTLRDMTPVRDRDALLGAVDELRVGGSTNLEAGLTRGYGVARAGFRPGASNRVVLLSDGLANVGNTSAEPILTQVREAAARQISLLGVGVGSDYGDALMEQLADRGDGFVVYVSQPEQARRIFVDRLPASLAVRALDAKVQVTFDPAAVRTYRLIGYDNRALNRSDFRDDRVDGGEVGPGQTVTALYAVQLKQGASGRVADARIRWLDPVTRESSEAAATVSTADLGSDFGQSAPRLRVSYAAAYFAEYLRRSPYGAELRLTDLAAVAERAGEDADVTDLASTIRRADSL
jgi:Ca-activated chloride channel family protein